MPPKLQKLDEILKIVNRDVPSTKEVADLVSRIISAVREVRKYLENLVNEHKDTLEDSLSETVQEMNERIDSFEREVSTSLSDSEKDTDKKIKALIKDLNKSLEGIAKLIPEAVSLTDVEARLETLEQEPPVTDEEIRNKLEGLEGDDRLDKSAIKGLDEEFDRLEKKIDEKPTGIGGGGRQLSAVPFSFTGDGATTQFYLPTEPAGKGWFLFAHLQGQWLQKNIHYSINKKVFDTAGGSSPFTAEVGTVIEGFLIF